MKTLPWVAIFLFLPLLFFSALSAALLTSVGGMAVASSAEEAIVVNPSGSLFSSLPPDQVVLGESTVAEDARPLILKNFLLSYHSDLAPYTNLILEVSRQYKLDWRLLVAIAGAESTFCRTIPPGGYNCWGWGIHSRGTLGFSSYEEGIRTVAKGLRGDFLEDGLTTVEEIMSRYAPISLQNGGSWARAGTYFMDQLERAEYY